MDSSQVLRGHRGAFHDGLVAVVFCAHVFFKGWFAVAIQKNGPSLALQGFFLFLLVLLQSGTKRNSYR